MKPKKQFSQNFLTSIQTVEDIVRAGEVTKTDIVLEIGPGKGILTEKLLEKAEKVIAIEKDNDLLPFLKEKFALYIKKGTLELAQQDILETNPSLLGLKTGTYKLIANIPYYITGEILQKFLETEVQPSRMVLMVQKEVAERILAKKGKESLLSLSIKAYGSASLVRKVGKGSFYPSPSVDSAVIKIGNISKNFFRGIDEKAFFSIIKAGFAHKRKFLINNLSSLFPKEQLADAWNQLGLNTTARAEDLSLINWKDIFIKLR